MRHDGWLVFLAVAACSPTPGVDAGPPTDAGSVTSGDGGLDAGNGDAGPPIDAGCVRRTCEDAGVRCGPIDDGCGGVSTCGTCPAPTTCGGGGFPGRCGSSVCGIPCIPTSCRAQGAECGIMGDGCGAIINCGSCFPGDTCGGGGVPQQCGRATDAGCGVCPPGACGQRLDACGALDCGQCADAGCTPRSCLREQRSCGLVLDTCLGIQLTCGSCWRGSACTQNDAGFTCQPDGTDAGC
jgi:hypothetical protein